MIDRLGLKICFVVFPILTLYFVIYGHDWYDEDEIHFGDYNADIELTYDVVYYKKVNFDDIELLMKSCVKKDGLWIDDKCVFLSELQVDDYIRLEILEDELSQQNLGNDMRK